MKNLFHKQGYPGECAYSIVARAHLASPLLSWKDTNEAIFGTTYVRLHPALPGRINAISRLIDISADELRLSISAHPLVAFGLSLPHKRMSLMASELEDSASKVIEVSGLSASKLSFRAALKCCSACQERDDTDFGVAYWHIVHQIPGMIVCPQHKLFFQYFLTGDGGVNHKYLLPLWKVRQTESGSEKSLFFSIYLSELYRLLCVMTPITQMDHLYTKWLDVEGYITKNGRIRWRSLKLALAAFWEPVFNEGDNSLPTSLRSFNFIPKMVHHRKSTHYLRHALLMAFLTKTPEEFFEGPKKRVYRQEPKKVITRVTEQDILLMLNQNVSMRKIAQKLRRSINYIKQIALRNHIQIDKRPKRITADMERVVWRKAVLGVHRKEIASAVKISIGAVEQIIQSHDGLSQWRHHILMKKRLQDCKEELATFIIAHPGLPRNYIKKHCGAYMWLYKHNKEWLYSQLPNKQPRQYYTSINWKARDMELVEKLVLLEPRYNSLSQLDRELGGHRWLLKYKDKLPKASKLAGKLIQGKHIGGD